MKVLLLVAIAIAALVCPTLAQPMNSACSLPHSLNGDGTYMCLAYLPSWSYNSNTKTCVPFIYGGCGGNANLFESKEECENMCKRK